MKRLLILLMMLFIAYPASAHKPSDSYLTLQTNPQVEGQWDIALRDLEYAVGLDQNNDAQISWGELKQQQKKVTDYALSRLQIQADGKPCTLRPGNFLVDNHTDGTYAVLTFTTNCENAQVLDLNYSLLFDVDPQHRGLLKVIAKDTTRTGILSPEQPSQRLELVKSPPLLQQFFTFVKEGTWHIWIGFDHILFLITLLLPAVLERKAHTWVVVSDFKTALGNVLKIVTAFTVAHSITLSLASLGVIELPSRWVESAIALSVVLAALNNLYPVIRGKLWMVAFGFGLIHGFGFASVLADLGLPGGALLLSLVGFNVGVELGQLAIVMAFLPLAFWLRDTAFYRQIAFMGGSVAVVVMAGVWLAERIFDFTLIG